EDAAEQRVGSEPVGPVERERALAHRIEPRDVGHHVLRRAALQAAGLLILGEARPQAAHRVVYGGGDLYRLVGGVGADELLVYLEDAFEFLEDGRAADALHLVAEIEVDHVPAADAEAVQA